MTSIKQDNKRLFSFFSKKTLTLPSAVPSAVPISGTCNFTSNNTSIVSPSVQQLKLLSQITVGTKIAIFWPDDNEYYPCMVHAHCPRDGMLGKDEQHRYTLHYEDGEIETLHLTNERFRIIGGRIRSSTHANMGDKSYSSIYSKKVSILFLSFQPSS